MLAKLVVLLCTSMMLMSADSFHEVTGTSYDNSHDHDHDLSTTGEHKHHTGCGFQMNKHEIIEGERRFQELLKYHNLDKINPRSLIGKNSYCCIISIRYPDMKRLSYTYSYPFNVQALA